MRTVTIGTLQVSGLCIGGNPFSGFSHQNRERDREMIEYNTPERIREALSQAEAAGINTVFARVDDNILGTIDGYWKAGGTIQWFAQVSVDKSGPDSWRGWMARAIETGAHALYIHGGVVDNWHANGKHELLHEALSMMRDAGKVSGFAGHRPDAHEWIRDNLDVDFQMCCYYNPTDRSKDPAHQGEGEKWHDDDRAAMLKVIATIEKPVVHYKVLAAANKPVGESWERLGTTVRPSDIVCLGMFLKDDPEIITKNVALFERIVEKK
jgi:hypothetical protein